MTHKHLILTLCLVITIIFGGLFGKLAYMQGPIDDDFDFPMDNPTGKIGYDIQNANLSGYKACFDAYWYELYHAGEDWFASEGTEVKAVANGVVTYTHSLDYPGNVIILEHTLSDSSTIYSMYGHLEYDNTVTLNQVITRGDVIGHLVKQELNDGTDNTHLHWEIRNFRDGSFVCNDGSIPTRGYTYPNHPDSFPGRCERYHNPTEYVNNPQTGYCQVFLPLIRKDPTPTPTPTPTITPTPLPTATPASIPCVEGQDLIVNGGLEQDAGSWPQWMQDDGDTAHNWPLIDDENPYQGIYGIWMGGRNDADEEIYQVITLTDNIDWGEITFQFYITTTETGSGEWDYLYWDLKKDRNGESVLQNPVSFSNQDATDWILQPVHFTHLYRVTDKRLRLSISDKTDGSKLSSFFIDDVKFITHCD
jgi:hypothetical protein